MRQEGSPLDVATLLKTLTGIPAISGREAPVAAVLRTLWEPLGAEVRIDRLGNCLGLLPGNGPAPRPRVLAAAHMDQIGFMVSAIEPGGFLRLARVGGWDPRILPAQELVVHGRRPLPGIVGVKPSHLITPEDKGKVVPIDQLYLDPGLPAAVVKELVAVGDPVTPRAEAVPLLNERFAAPACDDRACLAVLTLALEELKSRRPAADFVAAGTLQEEFGHFLGARTAAFGTAPDVAIAVDVTFGSHPGSEHDSFPLAGGPTVLVGSSVHPRIARLMRDVCRQEEILHAVEVIYAGSGTDADAMQVAGAGAATGIISVPIRYMHTPVETLSLADVRAAAHLLAGCVARIDAAFVEALTWDT